MNGRITLLQAHVLPYPNPGHLDASIIHTSHILDEQIHISSKHVIGMFPAPIETVVGESKCEHSSH